MDLDEDTLETLNNSLTSIHEGDLYSAINEIPDDVLAQTIGILKTQGNDLFAEHSYDLAIEKYTQGIVALMRHDDKVTLTQLLCNRGLANLYIKKHDECMRDLNLCLKIDPENIKGRYRKGLLLFEQNKHDDAKRYFKSALELSPGNKEIMGKIAKCETALNIMRSMLGEKTSNVEDLNSEQTGGFFSGEFVECSFNPSQKWYTDDIKAQRIHQLLRAFSDVRAVRSQAESPPELKPYDELLDENVCLLGTGMGSFLISPQKRYGIEKYPTLARLSMGMAQKNAIINKYKCEAVVVNKDYDAIHAIDDLKFEPNLAIFTDWDYTGLGTGWLSAKNHWRKNVLKKNGKFYPERLRCQFRIVKYDARADATWSAAVQKPFDHMEYLSVWNDIDIQETGRYSISISTVPGTAMGVEYKYMIVMPHGDFEVTHEHAFQRFDCTETGASFDMDVNVRVDRILFGKWSQKYDSPSHPELWLSLVQDNKLQCAFDACVAKLPDDSNIIDLRLTSAKYNILDLDSSIKKCEGTADMVVFDMFDCGGLGTGIFAILPKLRSLLKPSGMLCPSHFSVYAQLIECRNNNATVDDFILDYSLTNAYRYSDEYSSDRNLEYKTLSDPFLIEQWDLSKVEGNDETNHGPFTVKLTRKGTVSAIRFWFRLDLSPGKKIISHAHNWNYAIQYLPEYELKEGDEIDIQAKHDANGFQFGIIQGAHTPHQTPRFDPRQIKNTIELQNQLKELMGRLKYQASERREVFAIASKMCISPSRFHILPSVAHTFLNNLLC